MSRMNVKASFVGSAALIASLLLVLASNPLTVSASPDDPPEKPTGLTGTVAHNYVALTWADPGDDSITGYQVLRRNKAVDGPGVFHVHVDDTGSAATSYTDTGVAAESFYVYRVKARNAAGLSPESSYFNARTPAEPEQEEQEGLVQGSSSDPPAAPRLMGAAVSPDGEVTLLWRQDPADDSVAGYRILRGPSEDTLAEIVSDTGNVDTTYTDATAPAGQTLFYAVQARNAAGLSEQSNTESVTTPRGVAAQDDEEQCPGGFTPGTPTVVIVSATPIVVPSTTADYFVVSTLHSIDGATRTIPWSVTRGLTGATSTTLDAPDVVLDRLRVDKYAVDSPGDVDGDCADDLTDPNPVNPMAPIDADLGAIAVPDDAAFNALALGDTDDGALKFLLIGLDGDHAGVYFQNSNNYPAHTTFLDQLGWTYDPASMVPCWLRSRSDLTAPNGDQGLVYFSCERVVPIEETELRHALLAANWGLARNDLVYHVASHVLPLYQRHLESYRSSHVPFIFADDLNANKSYEALKQAESYGFLRRLDPSDRPTPRDIPIYETIPNELPRVAGIITTVPQTPLAHVNLRAIQDRVPNAYIRDATSQSDIAPFLNSYVKFTVYGAGYTLRSATREEVDAHYASSRPAQTQTPQRDLSVTAITPLSEIGFDDWDAFGVKAANVAVLGTLGFPAGTVPDGFAIPFSFYDRFMQETPLGEETVLGKKSAPDDEKLTLSAETTLASAVSAMLAHAYFQSDYDIQEEMLDDLRDAIKDATSPQFIIDALTAMHGTYPEGQSLRYRSSTNNEDLPGFNGAGLYDSKTQKPEETAEDGIDKSLKQVYASLWNFRAFTERDFHRIDHLVAAMGVLVHPNYSDERVNGVAVSADTVRGNPNIYYVNSQVGEDLVTNPEANSLAEEILIDREFGNYWVLSTSNQVDPGTLLLTDEQVRQLWQHLGVIHAHFEGLYPPRPDGEPFAMEIEFKITSEDILAIKQARPWIFGTVGGQGGTPPSQQTDELASETATGSGSSEGGSGGGGGSSSGGGSGGSGGGSSSEGGSGGGGGGGGGGSGESGPALTAPRFTEGLRTTRELPLSARPGDVVGGPIEATHPDDDDLTYSLSGAHAHRFTVDAETGRIRLGETGLELTLGQTYTVNLTATDEDGTSVVISIVIEATHHRYDVNRNGVIERNEVVDALRDYFNWEITREEIIALIGLYFAEAG